VSRRAKKPEIERDEPQIFAPRQEALILVSDNSVAHSQWDDQRFHQGKPRGNTQEATLSDSLENRPDDRMVEGISLDEVDKDCRI
jgi:hypothetical protein